MEILLWLAPPAVVTMLAIAWTSWRGRGPRHEESRDEAVRRLGEALTRPEPRGRLGRARPRPGYRVPPPIPDPSTGVAVRAPRRSAS